MEWRIRLKQFFLENNYIFIYVYDRIKQPGFMGVAVAFPEEIYVLKKTQIDIISETKEWLETPSVVPWYHKLQEDLGKWCAEKIGKTLYHTHNIEDYNIAHFQSNSQIMLELEFKADSTSFIIANYHMPCLFKRPRVMMIHAALSCQLAQQFAGDKPLIYCGDFNSTPNTSVYHLITVGHLERNHPDHPRHTMPADDKWIPNVKPLRSVYKEVYGKEPNFTNYSQDSVNDKLFIDVLDYIFISEHWQVLSTEELPETVNKYKTPLPDDEEPSDHLLIGATLHLGD